MPNNIISYIYKRVTPETAKNLMTLMSSSFAASIIPILFAPIYSRLYSPENYGVFGIVIALASLLSIVAYSHVPQTIMLAKTNEVAFENFQLSIIVNIIICSGALLLAILVLFGSITLNMALIFDPIYLLIPVITFLNGLIQSISVWLNRNKRYRKLSVYRILQVIVSAITQLILGFYHAGHYGIIISYLTGCVAALFYLYYTVSEIRIAVRYNKSILIDFIQEYKGLLQFSMPAELINNFSNQLPVLFLGHFGGSNAVGLFNFSNRMLSLPSSYATSAISEIFKQKATVQYHETGSCRSLVLKTTRSLILVLIIPFVLAMIFAPDIFAFVFGERWREAGNYSRLIGILFFCKTIFSPVSYVIYIAKKFRISFYMDILVIITSLVSLLLGFVILKSIHAAILLYACNFGLLYFLTFFLSYKYSVNENP